MTEPSHEIEEILEIGFDLSLVEHLGSQLYTELPPILGEFISNAYDADADEVRINFLKKSDNLYDIIIEDDGYGIAHGEKDILKAINERFLTIGRKKRVADNAALTPKGRRVHGKKGIGKLAGFGISKLIEVKTISNNILNCFSLDYDDMINASINKNKYYPEHTIKNQKTTQKQGTTITLKNFNRKGLSLSATANSISKRFKVFDNEFICKLSLDGKNEIIINRDIYLSNFESSDKIQFTWNIPNDLEENPNLKSAINFIKDNDITGSIFTAHTPLIKKEQGIVLYANGKLAQDNYYFSERANDQFYQYMSGYLNVDFIDKDNYIDNISSARNSLLWDNDDLASLKMSMSLIINFIQKEWRNKRTTNRKKIIEEKGKIKLSEWMIQLNELERPVAEKLINSIISNNKLDIEETEVYIEKIQDIFSFDIFSNMASDLVKHIDTADIHNVIDFIDKWKLIEAKEISKVAQGRIDVINTFEEMIRNQSSETKVIQPFLEHFPWLINPQIVFFEREKQLSSMLKEIFPDDTLPEKDGRIDFLCTDTNNKIILIELKRPGISLDDIHLIQLNKYIDALLQRYPNHQIESHIIVEPQPMSRGQQESKLYKTSISKRMFEQQNGINVDTYSNLLNKAKSYHKDFINKYEEIRKIGEI